jgi:hypothetical protein
MSLLITQLADRTPLTEHEFGDDVLIAPGHTDADVGDEIPVIARFGGLRAKLAAFGSDESTGVDRITQVGTEPASAARIVAVNKGVEVVGDEAASEPERGPNNCAAGGS